MPSLSIYQPSESLSRIKGNLDTLYSRVNNNVDTHAYRYIKELSAQLKVVLKSAKYILDETYKKEQAELYGASDAVVSLQETEQVKKALEIEKALEILAKAYANASQETLSTQQILQIFFKTLHSLASSNIEFKLPSVFSEDPNMIRLMQQFINDVFELFDPGSEDFMRLFTLVLPAQNPAFETLLNNIVTALKEIHRKKLDRLSLTEDEKEYEGKRLQKAIKTINWAYGLSKLAGTGTAELIIYARKFSDVAYKTYMEVFHESGSDPEFDFNEMRLDIFHETLQLYYPEPTFNPMIEDIVEEIRNQSSYDLLDDQMKYIETFSGVNDASRASNRIYCIYAKVIAGIDKSSPISFCLFNQVVKKQLTEDGFIQLVKKIRDVLNIDASESLTEQEKKTLAVVKHQMQEIIETALSLTDKEAMTLAQMDILLEALSQVTQQFTSKPMKHRRGDFSLDDRQSAYNKISLETEENQPYVNLIQQLQTSKKAGERSTFLGKSLVPIGLSLIVIGILLTVASFTIVNIPFAIFSIEYGLAFLTAGVVTSGVGSGLKHKGTKILDTSDDCIQLAESIQEFQNAHYNPPSKIICIP